MSAQEAPPTEPVSTGTVNGRTAVVTGASRGLGLAIARRLAAAGARLLLVARDAEPLAAAATGLGGERCGIGTLAADVTEPDAPSRICEWIQNHGGRADILVNNAGAILTKSAWDITDDEWRQIFEVNVHAPFRLSRAVGAVMRAHGAGKIVNVASVYAIVGERNVLPYVASKGALVQMTKGLAVEWARDNIQVNAVAPGYVETALNSPALEDDALRTRILRRTPAHRLGQSDEVAEAVHFLVGPHSDYVTGHVLAVDGGWLAW